jgi:hypothetical protein
MSKLRDFSQLPNILFDMDLLPEDSYLVGFLRFWRHYATRKETFRGSYRKLANVIRMPKSCVARMVPEWEQAGFVTKEIKTKPGENREEMVLTINVEAFWEFNNAYYPERPKLGQQNIIVPPNISTENSNVPNWDSNVPPRDISVPDWDNSVPRASSNSDVILGNTTVISGNTEVTNLRASIDDAILSQYQNEIASLKAQIDLLLANGTPHQGNVQNSTDPGGSTNTLPKGGAFPTSAGLFYVHPEHSFITLDDLTYPTMMIVTLTPAFPHPYFSEMEDKRRERIAVWEILPMYKKQGLEVQVQWRHEQEQQTVIDSSTVVVGGNDQHAILAPVVSPTMPQSGVTGINAHQPQDTATESDSSAKEEIAPVSEETQQASGDCPIAPVATENQPAPKRSRKPRVPKEPKPPKPKISSDDQARIDMMFDCLDKAAQEALKEETGEESDFAFSRPDTDRERIYELLQGRKISQERVHLVFMEMWKTPAGRDGFLWKEHMSIASFCRNYDKMLLSALGKRKSSKSNQTSLKVANGGMIGSTGEPPQLITAGPLAGQPDYESNPWS